MAGEAMIFRVYGLGSEVAVKQKKGNGKDHSQTNSKFNGSHGVSPNFYPLFFYYQDYSPNYLLFAGSPLFNFETCLIWVSNLNPGT
jgi:hypothetical protein